MNTIEYISNKFNLDLSQKTQPIEIPNTDRNTLATLLEELHFDMGAEVGVESGIYSETLLKSNPRLKLYSIDAWEAYDGYRDHVSQEKVNQIHQDAVQRLSPYECIVIKGYSLEVVNSFKDNSLDFVYLDGNHEFQYVVNDICEWSKKVKPGGIIAGHDYIKRKGNGNVIGVVPAVNAFMEAYQIKPFFVLGRKEARKGELRDKSRSWFYVKPNAHLT